MFLNIFMDKNQWNINISAWRWKDGGLVVQMKNLKNIMKTDKVLSVCQSTLMVQLRPLLSTFNHQLYHNNYNNHSWAKFKFLKPLQNKKGQKNWGTRQKSSPFIRKKRLLFCRVPQIFWPFLFWSDFTYKRKM